MAYLICVDAGPHSHVYETADEAEIEFFYDTSEIYVKPAHWDNHTPAFWIALGLAYKGLTINEAKIRLLREKAERV